jgi:hypothetical protein
LWAPHVILFIPPSFLLLPTLLLPPPTPCCKFDAILATAGGGDGKARRGGESRTQGRRGGHPAVAARQRAAAQGGRGTLKGALHDGLERRMSRGMNAHGCEEAVAAMNRPETHRQRRIEPADELGSAAGWRPGILDFRLYGPWMARRRGGAWSRGSVEGPGGGGFGWRQLDARLGWLCSLRPP